MAIKIIIVLNVESGIWILLRVFAQLHFELLEVLIEDLGCLNDKAFENLSSLLVSKIV